MKIVNVLKDYGIYGKLHKENKASIVQPQKEPNFDLRRLTKSLRITTWQGIFNLQTCGLITKVHHKTEASLGSGAAGKMKGGRPL